MAAEDLSEWLPRNPDEGRDSAVAVRQRRRLAEYDEMVDALTVRERFLIEETWDTAARQARDKLLALLHNPQAVTLDAKAVEGVVRNWSDSVKVFTPPGWTKFPGEHHDPRVVGIVQRATRYAEEEGKREALD